MIIITNIASCKRMIGALFIGVGIYCYQATPKILHALLDDSKLGGGSVLPLGNISYLRMRAMTAFTLVTQ